MQHEHGPVQQQQVHQQQQASSPLTAASARFSPRTACLRFMYSA
jgi:hypothetical protein